MPIIFFVSGACNYLAKRKSFFSFIKLRLRRILIPYFMYTVIALIITFIHMFLVEGKIHFIIIPTWMIPINPISTVPFLTTALWFVPCYLVIVLLCPLLLSFKDRYNDSNLKYIPLSVMFLLVILLDIANFEEIQIINQSIFYMFYFYLGFFYEDIEKNINKKNTKAIFIIILGIITMTVLHIKLNYTLDMQINKFPPNTMFFAYSSIVLSFIYLNFNKIEKFIINTYKRHKLIHYLIDTYSKHGYIIYLFHPLSFLMLITFTKLTNIGVILTRFEILGVMLAFILILFLNLIWAKMFSWLERL
jgi:fucose 4-O-acetylase-like acetyltransferase